MPTVHFDTKGKNISIGIWVAVILGAIACTVAVSAVVTLLIARRYARKHRNLSRRHSCKFLNVTARIVFN